MAQKFSIVVLGARGMLGTAVVYDLNRAGHTVRAVDRTHFDAAVDPIKRLDLRGVDYVINALGLINRRMTTEPENFYLVNSLFPRVLADYCAAQAVRLIHISTDCVFDGYGGPYTETSETTATDLYGRSKALGEPANCLVIRTSIIGPEQQHHYSLLTWFLAQTTACRGYTNHLWNGMTTLQLSRVMDQIMQADLYTPGVRHVFSDDVTKYELLRLMQAAYQHPIDIKPDDDVRAKDSRLRTLHPEFSAQLKIPALRDQLAELPALSDARGRWRATIGA
jgi:dTDP-4-dehydrorhamnose reductase